MDADGLPLVGPGVDYTKVEAIQQKRMVAFVNHFITHTANFLNKFSSVCEEKLEKISDRLQELEVTMNILEAKLTSIQGAGLESVTAPTTTSSGDPSAASFTDNSGSSGAPPPPPAPPTPGQPQGQGQDQTVAPPSEPVPPPEPEVADNPVSKDPRYARFFKMLQVGVPEPAVRMKMQAEGLDPDMLATPDAPAPAASKAPAHGSDDSDFSNDSDEAEDSFSD